MTAFSVTVKAALPTAVVVFGLMPAACLRSAGPLDAAPTTDAAPEPDEQPPDRLGRKARPKAPAPTRAPAAVPSWHGTLAEGLAEAQRRRKPVLVRFSGESCPWCRKLEADLDGPALRGELGGWVLVTLDVDRAADEARSLSVAAIPALRVLTPTGRLEASSDGYLPPEKLLAWLKKSREAATGTLGGDWVGEETPTAAGFARLLEALKARDPAVREATVRRLLPYPRETAARVSAALAEGSLQQRLSALELLTEWRAPVAGLDPWRPETLTKERLRAVEAWAAHPPAADESRPLSPEQLLEARRDLDRLPGLPGAEAAALRDRLARHGPALMPEVLERLRVASDDRAREQLTALRYRLAARDALALGWPGGLERLASARPGERREAVQELARRATAADEPLLLELFSSPDPLVREIALQSLNVVAGGHASKSLTRLLDDPEPNVRSAVLKQLAEKPSGWLIPKLSAYVTAEKDPDLVVHAVRALRALKSNAPVDTLETLLKHQSWRVRAEAADALADSIAGYDQANTDERKARVRTTLVGVLRDPDGFVVGRAVGALKKADFVDAVEPLVEVIRTHPEIGTEAIAAMSYGSNALARALPHLRTLCRHPQPAIRAAAIDALSSSPEQEDVTAELHAGLLDADGAVRLAAAEGVLRRLNLGGVQSINNERTRSGRGKEETDRPDREEVDPVPIARARAASGLGRTPLGDVLPYLLKATDPAERLAAALPLIALGAEDGALPVLAGAVRADPALCGKAGRALEWLPWPRRLETFRLLLSLKPDTEQLAWVLRSFSAPRDPKAVPALWDLAGQAWVTVDSASALEQAVESSRFAAVSGSTTNGQWEMKPAERKKAVAEIKPRAETGPEVQRLVALVLLRLIDPDEAAAVAARIAADRTAPPGLRGDAFLVHLLRLSNPDQYRFTRETLRSDDSRLRRKAVFWLIDGDRSRVHQLRGGIYVDRQGMEHARYSSGRGSDPASEKAFVPEAPPGLTVEDVRPLLADPDPATAAGAAYLLTLLGEPDGLEPVLRYYRAHGRREPLWTRLVCQAVAAVGDDGNVPLLEDILRGLPEPGDSDAGFSVRDFYWAIRSLDGPNALRLRKQIRAEVGMDYLR